MKINFKVLFKSHFLPTVSMLQCSVLVFSEVGYGLTSVKENLTEIT